MVRQHPVDDLGRQVHAALGRLGGQGGQLVGVGQRIQAEHQVPAQAGAQVLAQRHRQRGAVAGHGQREGAAGGGGFAPAVVQGEQAGLPVVVHAMHIVHRDELRHRRLGVGAGQHAQHVLAVGGVDVDGVGARGERAQQMAAAAAGRAPYVERPAGASVRTAASASPLGPAMKLFSEGAGAGRTSSSSWRFMGSYSIRLACGAVRTSGSAPRDSRGLPGCGQAARRVAGPVAGAAEYAGGRIRQRIPAVKSGQTEWVKNRVNRLTKTAGQNRYRPTLHFKPPEGRCRASPPFRPWLPADSGRLGASAPACGQLRAAAS